MLSIYTWFLSTAAPDRDSSAGDPARVWPLLRGTTFGNGRQCLDQETETSDFSEPPANDQSFDTRKLILHQRIDDADVLLIECYIVLWIINLAINPIKVIQNTIIISVPARPIYEGAAPCPIYTRHARILF